MDFSLFWSLISPSNSLWRDSLRLCCWMSHVSSLLLVSGIVAKLSVHVLCFGSFLFLMLCTLGKGWIRLLFWKKIVSLKPRQTHHQTIFQVLKRSKNHTIQSAGCLVSVTLIPAKSSQHGYLGSLFSSVLSPVSIRTTNTWFLKIPELTKSSATLCPSIFSWMSALRHIYWTSECLCFLPWKIASR